MLRIIAKFNLLILLLLTGCSTSSTNINQLKSDLVEKTVLLNSVTSSVRVAYHTSEKNIAARGLIVYQRPEKLRLVILSPFGTIIMEALIDGKQLTLVYPTDGVAFTGKISEMPKVAGQQAWSLLQLLLDSEIPQNTKKNEIIYRKSDRGGEETLVYKNGLLDEKHTTAGSRIKYREYRHINGVWIATELLLETSEGERIKLNFEDPEVNTNLEVDAFKAQLTGLRLLPISELRFR